MNIKRKITAIFAPVGIAALIALGSPAMSQAHADDAPVFTPYTAHQDWYKAGTEANGDIWPQTTTVITCGGIVQHDDYTISTQQQDTDYKALIAGGVLNSGDDDAEFSPHNYSVVDLPACLIPVTITAVPYVTPTCVPGFNYQENVITTPATDHITWTTEQAAGMGQAGTEAHADAGYTITGQTTWTWPRFTQIKCPVVKPTPPVVKPTPKPTPTTPVTTVTTPTTTATPVAASVNTPENASGQLAFTGSTLTVPELIIAGFLLLGGLTLLIASKIRRANKVIDNAPYKK